LLKELIYKVLAFYISHFTFPFKGEKYFRRFLKQVSLNGKLFKKQLHNGQKILLKYEDHIQQTILWYGFYEKESILTWEHFIKEDFVVMDIGANIGYYTLIAANKTKMGTVHSFEPITENYEALKNNILLNNLSNVIINNVGISNVDATETYYISAKDNIGMSGLRPPENYSGISEKKETITLDAYVIKKNLSRVDIIKIDIEGNEMNALLGMKMILKKFKPILFIEIINEHLIKFNSNADDVYSFLQSHGYKAFEIKSVNNLVPVTNFKDASSIIFIQ
jgi:FkbM family methyltransferase